MVEYLQKELSNRVAKEGFSQINWEVTERITQEPIYANFNKWAKENGIISNAIRYPVAFGEGGHLIGCAAKRPIGFNEAFVYIPMKVVICESKILLSEVGHIIKKYPKVFSEKGRTNGEHMTIIFFTLHEMSKGEDSFWAPYFAISEYPDQVSMWNEDDLAELQDPIFMEESKDEDE